MCMKVLKFNANFNKQGIENNTSLHLAAQYNGIDAIEALLNYNLNSLLKNKDHMGEFNIIVRITFQDPSESPIETTHFLKVLPPYSSTHPSEHSSPPRSP
jgi:ankyrin repeat protein